VQQSMMTLKLSLLAILLLTLLQSSLQDNTLKYYVDGTNGASDGSGSSGSPFLSIQQAIDTFKNESASDPDIDTLEIVLKEGTYIGAENIGITYDMNVTISNDDDSNGVILDCEDTTNGIAVISNSGTFQMSWIKVMNCLRGLDIAYVANSTNSGVFLDSVTFDTISDVGIKLQNPSSVIIENCLFSDNLNGGVNIIGDRSSGVDVLNCGFNSGAGIYISNMNGGNIVGNNFNQTHGVGTQSPAGIYLTGGTWDVEENEFNEVVATQQSAVMVYSYGEDDSPAVNVSIVSCTFSDCSSDENGGAISLIGNPAILNNMNVEISKCTFTNNYGENGGAVFATSTNLTISKCEFTSNSADEHGGAIDIEFGSNLFLYKNTFDGNLVLTNDTSASTVAISCCGAFPATDGNCTSLLFINDDGYGDYTSEIDCTNFDYVTESEYLGSAISYAYQTPPDGDSGSLWWLWVLISLVVIGMIVVVGVAVGAFIWQKKKRSYSTLE